MELCCKRGGGGVRGLALVLTAMNLARHSKEGKHRQFQMSSLIKNKSQYSSIYTDVFRDHYGLPFRKNTVDVDWFLPWASLWEFAFSFWVIVLDMETNPSSPHSSGCTDKKDNKIFLIFRELRKVSSAKSCMNNGFLIYGYKFAHFLIMTTVCTRSHLNFLYKDNFLSFLSEWWNWFRI